VWGKRIGGVSRVGGVVGVSQRLSQRVMVERIVGGL
jgi:hypothetical protein